MNNAQMQRAMPAAIPSERSVECSEVLSILPAARRTMVVYDLILFFGSAQHELRVFCERESRS
jgi:hypothetical protein